MLFLAILAEFFAVRPVFAQGDWSILGHPTTHDLNKLSFIDNDRGWAVGDSGTILATTDGGANWAAQTSPVTYDIVDVDMIDAQIGWALAQQFPAEPLFEYGTSVLRTTNGGGAWTVQSTFNELFLHAIEFHDAARGVLGGEQGKLWRTTNGGANWIPGIVDSAAFAVWPVRDFEFYTANYGVATGGYYDVTGLVWRTTDGGKNWTHKRVAGEPIFGTHFFDSLNVVCVGGDLDFGAGMVETANGGALWEYTYLGIWGQGSAVDFATPGEGWAALGFAGTYMVTLDSGSTWTASYTPDSTAMHDIVFTDALTGYMVGSAGTVLKYVPVGTNVGGPRVAHSSEPLLQQNQPNPFHRSTRFDFRMGRAGAVSLKVYDLAGREVATVVDEALGAGRYARVFDGSGLPSGVYYYKLIAGSYVETKKMVLLR
ncbi:MAG: YCF48-related protein [bacterium]